MYLCFQSSSYHYPLVGADVSGANEACRGSFVSSASPLIRLLHDLQVQKRAMRQSAFEFTPLIRVGGTHTEEVH